MTQGPGTARAMSDILIEPKDCALVLVDQQAGLAFGVGSIDRQMLLNNVIALARTATVFGMPIVASTSATKVYSGPLMPAIRAATTMPAMLPTCASCGRPVTSPT